MPRWQVGGLDGSAVVKESVTSSVEDDVLGLAAEIAYHAALAVLPFLLILAALPAILSFAFNLPDAGQRISDEAQAHLSANTAALIRSIVDQVARISGWTPVTIGLFGTLLAGSSTTSSLRKALNRIYGYEEALPFLQRKATELAVTVAAGGLIFLGFLAILIGPILLTPYSGPGAQILSISFAVVCVSLSVAVVYWLCPSNENTFRWVTPGALLFVVVWLSLSVLFSVYLSRFGVLNQVYGSLGAMIVLLIWLYWSNLALLMGAELNAAIGRRADPRVMGNPTAGAPDANDPMSR